MLEVKRGELIKVSTANSEYTGMVIDSNEEAISLGDKGKVTHILRSSIESTTPYEPPSNTPAAILGVFFWSLPSRGRSGNRSGNLGEPIGNKNGKEATMSTRIKAGTILLLYFGLLGWIIWSLTLIAKVLD